MSLRQITHSTAVLCIPMLSALCITAVLPIAGATDPSVKIDSVAEKYAIQESSFEVNPKTGRAGIRLVYVYLPGRLGGDDSDRGPEPTIATLPGLTYDAAARAVVYNDGGKSITCATAATDHRVVFWRSTYMKPTGACRVASRLIQHTRDDGWRVERIHTLDTFFEVQSK